MTTQPLNYCRKAFNGLMAILLSISLISCGDDDESGFQPPELTQSGSNQMVAKIDGQWLIAENTNEADFKQFTTDDALSISGEDGDERLTFVIDLIASTDTYTLNNLSGDRALAFYRYTTADRTCIYNTSNPDVQYEMIVNMTKVDSDARIMSGTFSGWFFNTDCGRTEVEEGWFDISY